MPTVNSYYDTQRKQYHLHIKSDELLYLIQHQQGAIVRILWELLRSSLEIITTEKLPI